MFRLKYVIFAVIVSSFFIKTEAFALTTIGLDIATEGSLTVIGNVNMNDPSADTLWLGAAADTVTIAGDVSITDNNWAITAAGLASFAGLDSTPIGSVVPAAATVTTLASTGVTALGDNSATVAVNSSAWDISSAGAGSGFTTFVASGAITGGTLTDGTFLVTGGSATGLTAVSPTITTAPTAAGATWIDLGTVTTADINGGTLDDVVIGGASAAAGTFTSLTANGNIVLTDAQWSITGTGVATFVSVDGPIGSITPAAGIFTSITTPAITLGVTALTATGTELNYVTGVTSAIQTQLDAKQGTLTDSAGLAAALSDETGTGLAVFNTSPTLVTPALGVATATTINNVTLTVPATGSTLTIADGKTLTVSDDTTLATDAITFAGTEALTLAATKSVTFADAFTTVGGFALTLTSTGITNVTLPTSGTLATLDGAETFTNKILTSPTLTTPTLGVATGTSLATSSQNVFTATAGTEPAIFRSATATDDDLSLLPQAGGADRFKGIISSADLTGADKTWTFPNASGTVTLLGNSSTGTGAIALADSPVFTTSITTPAITLGATALTATGTELNYVDGVTSAIQTQLDAKQGTLTDSAGLAAALSDEVGSGAVVFATSPALVTPALGVATATSLNGLTVSTSTGTLTVADGSSLITSGANSLTLTTTAATNVTFPTSGTLLTGATANVFTADQTLREAVAGDDSALIFDALNASDTDFWLADIGDGGSDDDDTFQIGKGTTVGTTPYVTIDKDGKVGIGTTAPVTKLQISAGGVINVAVDGIDSTNIFTVDGTGNGLVAQFNNADGAGAETLLGFSYRNAGGTVPASLGYVIDSDGWTGVTKGSLVFKTRSVTTQTAASERMRIDSSGNVGVGTTTASTVNGTDFGGKNLNITNSAGTARMMVDGSTQADVIWNDRSAAADSRVFQATDSGASGILKFRSLTDAGALKNEILAMTTAGLVGVGTAAPSVFLHVLGTTEQLRLGYDTSNYASFTVGSAGTITLAPIGTNAGITLTPQGTGAISSTSGVTTGNGLSIASSTVTTGNVASLTSTSTAAGSNTQKVLNVATSGANSTATQTTYGGYFTNTHTGDASTNVALYASASGGTNNYAAILTGRVGINTATPTTSLEIVNTGSQLGSTTAYYLSNFSLNSGDQQGILTGYDSSGGGVIAGGTQTLGQPIEFWTYDGSSWAERMRISKTGQFLMGVTSATTPFVVNVTGEQLGSTSAYAIGYFSITSGDRQGISLGYDTSGGGVIAGGTQTLGQPIEFWTYNGSSWAERARISKEGNFGIGTSLFGTSAVGALAIKNGTAPTTSPADEVQLYAEDVSSSSELRVRDEAGNVTTLSPHNFSLFTPDASDVLPWSYYSYNQAAGKEINVDMYGAMRMVEEFSGKQLIYVRNLNKRGQPVDPSEVNRNIGDASESVKERVTGWVRDAFASMGAKIESGKVWMQNLSVKNIEADRATVSSGITTKDRVTGEYYCITVSSGQLIPTQGKCQ